MHVFVVMNWSQREGKIDAGKVSLSSKEGMESQEQSEGGAFVRCIGEGVVQSQKERKPSVGAHVGRRWTR